MQHLISLMPRTLESLADPPLTNPSDIEELNRLVALFHSNWQPISQNQWDGLAYLFASGSTPDWVMGCVQYRCRQARYLVRLCSTPSWPLPEPLAHPVHEFEGWVRTRSHHCRFPNPARVCVPAALAMECVEDKVSCEIEDFLDYWSLRADLARRARTNAEAFDLSVEEWCFLRCHQHQRRRGMGSFLAGAYLHEAPTLFVVH